MLLTIEDLIEMYGLEWVDYVDDLHKENSND